METGAECLKVTLFLAQAESRGRLALTRVLLFDFNEISWAGEQH